MRHPTYRVLRRSALLVAAMLALVWTSAALAGGDRGQSRDRLAFMDSRHAPAAQDVLDARSAKLLSDPPAATAALKDSLGVEGFVKLDPVTSTASFVGKTNGYLTGPSSSAASTIGLGYVKANAAALGLSADGVAALELRRDYVDILGTHHLSFVQEVNGVTVFGNGVKVNVAKDGRIINVTGSPVASLAGAPARDTGDHRRHRQSSPRSRTSAATRRPGHVDERTRTCDDASRRATTTEARLLQDAQRAYARVPDAAHRRRRLPAVGRRRRLGQGPLPATASRDSANGLAWDNRPGAVGRRHAALVRRQRPGGSWQFGAFNPLVGTDAGLSSNNTWVYSDINGSNGARRQRD